MNNNESKIVSETVDIADAVASYNNALDAFIAARMAVESADIASEHALLTTAKASAAHVTYNAAYETVQAAKYAYHRLIAAGRSEEA